MPKSNRTGHELPDELKLFDGNITLYAGPYNDHFMITVMDGTDKQTANIELTYDQTKELEAMIRKYIRDLK